MHVHTKNESALLYVHTKSESARVQTASNVPRNELALLIFLNETEINIAYMYLSNNCVLHLMQKRKMDPN